MIAVTDKNDPRIVLEIHHEQWTAAAVETGTAWHALMSNPPKPTLRKEYFEEQRYSSPVGQEFLQRKRETGARLSRTI